MVVCEHCGKGGEGGPLLKVETDRYRHKQCLPAALNVNDVLDVQLPPHGPKPKLWIAQVKPPSLEDIRGKRA